MDYLTFLKKQVERKQRLGKYKTALNYEAAGRSLAAYLRANGKVPDLPATALTDDLLQGYEQWLIDVRGLCRNSTSAYLRSLRAVWNRAVAAGRRRTTDPFAGVYTGVDRTAKRAIDLAAVGRLATLDLPRGPLCVSRDVFVFSFYARGMAFVDVAKLTRGNLRHDRLVYRRSKTRQSVSVKIEPPMRALIERYAWRRSPYLFPILSTHPFRPEEYFSALRTYNNHLRRLSRAVSSPIPLTSYVARHTWATTAQQLSIPTRVISESMGHTDESTTHIYLASIGADRLDEANRKVLRAVGRKRSSQASEHRAQPREPAPQPSYPFQGHLLPQQDYCMTSTYDFGPSDRE